LIFILISIYVQESTPLLLDVLNNTTVYSDLNAVERSLAAAGVITLDFNSKSTPELEDTLGVKDSSTNKKNLLIVSRESNLDSQLGYYLAGLIESDGTIITPSSTKANNGFT
jgi:hypothetical protein